MSTGICTAHEGRHEKREGCVQWDGSEETRLREELAEARRQLADARFRPMGDNHHNAAQCPYCGDPLRAATARATAAERERDEAHAAIDGITEAADKITLENMDVAIKLRAAESALAEARGVIRNAPHASDCVTRMWACVSKSCTCWKRGFAEPLPSVEELLAALTSAGEQEAEARTEGETAAKEK